MPKLLMTAPLFEAPPTGQRYKDAPPTGVPRHYQYIRAQSKHLLFSSAFYILKLNVRL